MVVNVLKGKTEKPKEKRKDKKEGGVKLKCSKKGKVKGRGDGRE